MLPQDGDHNFERGRTGSANQRPCSRVSRDHETSSGKSSNLSHKEKIERQQRSMTHS